MASKQLSLGNAIVVVIMVVVTPLLPCFIFCYPAKDGRVGGTSDKLVETGVVLSL